MLAWRLGVAANLFGQMSAVEGIAKADALGLANVEGVSTQKVSHEIRKNFDYNLTAPERTVVKNALRTLAMKMIVYRVETLPPDQAARRKVFEFIKELGIETVIANPDSALLPELDKLANEFAINVAVDDRRAPATVMAALEGRSKRIGVQLDIGAALEQGIPPLDAVRLLKDRLIAITLRDRSALGSSGREVPLGTGMAGLAAVFAELYKLKIKPLYMALAATGDLERISDLRRNAAAFETASEPFLAARVGEISRTTPITGPAKLSAEVKEKIAAAAPRQALVKPKKPRKLLVIDLNVGEGGHATIPHGNYAIELMAKNTGAFEAVFDNNLDNLKWGKIQQYDAVFLNNILGQLFFDPEVREGLLRFVREGGGVAGLHGATWSGRGWSEFAEMMGAGSGPHRLEEGTLKIVDKESPLNRGFTSPAFQWRDELYLYYVDGPYTKDKNHILFGIDTDKMDMSKGPYIRPDKDYGLSWIKSYGKGRVFNTGLGHTPELFMTPALAQHILGAIQFILGDLAADTTPTGKLEASHLP